MGYKEITVKMPTDFTDELLHRVVAKQLKTDDFTLQISQKSLDARKKNNIHWQVRVTAISDALPGEPWSSPAPLEIPFRKRDKRVVVVGSGPAGFFAAFFLQQAGFNVTIVERGSEVSKRSKGIAEFEKTGLFNAQCNYAFGEGGAGTFSDGKLTSRTKHISKEKQFILASYVKAGAPAEIEYMTHPHLGTDNLKRIVKNLRLDFEERGGTILFDTLLKDIVVEQGLVKAVETSQGNLPADYVVMATGHSAYETFRMLMQRGVLFRVKNFAIGSRVEHPQKLINMAQWGCEQLPGVKAAEYRLTSQGDPSRPVYTFCMCPGGVVVPATAYADANIVNGMSYYNRNAHYANAACVAGVNLEQLLGRQVSAVEALDWLEALEQQFMQHASGYKAPACTINDFIHGRLSGHNISGSYPLGLQSAPLYELLPTQITKALQCGLKDFSRKIKGFEKGVIMGLESKTSAPVQVLRNDDGRCSGFTNLWMAGEGSGYAGGIISSGADGLRSAMQIVKADD